MEDFVTFEIANKLKEKGYPQVKENTLAMYNEVGEWYSLARNLDDWEYSFEDFDEKDCVCPTISHVLKWLREEKKIHITIDFDRDMNWYFQIALYNTSTYEHSSKSIYKSYEETALSAIEYVLDNLI